MINQTSNNQTKYDLEDRTLMFSKNTISLCRKLPKDIVNRRLVDQLVRSSTSIGSNYREANDALGKKDFIHRLRISRKESKETIYWLELIIESNDDFRPEIKKLLNEAVELRNILSAIINKSE